MAVTNMWPWDELAGVLAASPENVLAGIRDVGLLLIGWLVASRVERSATALLASFGFEAVRRPPWLSSAAGSSDDLAGHDQASLTHSAALGCSGLVWLGIAWSLVTLHNSLTLATLAKAAIETLALLLVVGTLGLGLCHLLSDAILRLFVHSPLRRVIDQWAATDAEAAEPLSLSVARLCGVGIYLVCLVSLLIGGFEAFGWLPPGNLMASAWLLLLHFAGAVVVVLLGWLGVVWLDATQADLARPGGRLKAGIVLSTLLLAAISLPGVGAVVAAVIPMGLSAIFFGAAAVAGVAVGWPLRHRLKDVWAGVLLRLEQRQKIPLPAGGAVHIVAVDLLTTRLRCSGQTISLRNQAALHLLQQPPDDVEQLPIELREIVERAQRDSRGEDADAASERPAELTIPID